MFNQSNFLITCSFISSSSINNSNYNNLPFMCFYTFFPQRNPNKTSLLIFLSQFCTFPAEVLLHSVDVCIKKGKETLLKMMEKWPLCIQGIKNSKGKLYITLHHREAYRMDYIWIYSIQNNTTIMIHTSMHRNTNVSFYSDSSSEDLIPEACPPLPPL